MCKMPADQIQYSERYCDDYFEYRHVILPRDLASLVPRSHLMSETEWRNLGVQQSPDWCHFMIHNPEPHVLLFRRPKCNIRTQDIVNGIDLELDIVPSSACLKLKDALQKESN